MHTKRLNFSAYAEQVSTMNALAISAALADIHVHEARMKEVLASVDLLLQAADHAKRSSEGVVPDHDRLMVLGSLCARADQTRMVVAEARGRL